MKKFLISIFILFSVVSFGFSHSHEAVIELTHYIQKNYYPKASSKEEIEIQFVDGNKTPSGGFATFYGKNENEKEKIIYSEACVGGHSSELLLNVIHELAHFETYCMNGQANHNDTWCTIYMAVFIKVHEDISAGRLNDLLFMKELNDDLFWTYWKESATANQKASRNGKEPKYKKSLYNKVYNFKKED